MDNDSVEINTLVGEGVYPSIVSHKHPSLVVRASKYSFEETNSNIVPQFCDMPVSASAALSLVFIYRGHMKHTCCLFI